MPEKGFKSVTLPAPLVNEVKKAVQGNAEFSGMADFIKDSIRRNLDRIRKPKAGK